MKLLLIIFSLNASEPKDQVTKFYDWYLNMIETKEIYKMVTPANNHGQASLTYQPYIDSLKKLNTFHQDFINSELQTFEFCNSHLEQWTWEKYQWDEPRTDEHCFFLEYHRWFWTQEQVTDISIIDQVINRTSATVKLEALYNSGTDRVVMNSEITVSLKREQGNWLITNIKNSSH